MSGDVTLGEEFIWYVWPETRLVQYLALALPLDHCFVSDEKEDDGFGVECTRVYFTADAYKQLTDAWARWGEELSITQAVPRAPRILWIYGAGFTVFRRRRRRELTTLSLP